MGRHQEALKEAIQRALMWGKKKWEEKQEILAKAAHYL